MIRVRAGLVVLVGAALALTGCTSGAAGSCVAPEIAVSPASAHPGETVTISVANAFGACHDTGQYSARSVASSVEVTLIDAEGAESVLLTARAEGDASVTADVEVPADAAPGEAQAVLTAPEGAMPATLTVLAP